MLHLISGGSEAWGRRQQGDYTHHLPKFPISKECAFTHRVAFEEGSGPRVLPVLGAERGVDSLDA